jgi:ABC-type transport system involved in multi-copper enzyme maturation permease subunit
MIWLTWRQFRVQALVISALLAILAAVLLATGLSLATRYHASGVAACAANGDCGRVATQFLNSLANTIYRTLYLLGAALLLVIPAIIGIFWGAPLIARELESGTFRLAWNQSVTRDRWLAVKLGILGLAAVAAAGLLSLMIGWWAAPIEHAGLLAGPGTFVFSRFNLVMFDVRGVAPIGYAAFAFTLGVFVGVVVRRTLPAMAITLAIFAVVQIVMPLWIRPHLITPVRTTVPIVAANIQGIMVSRPGGPMAVSVGDPVIQGAWILSTQAITASGSASLGTAPQACQSQQGFGACANAIAQMHLRQAIVYQPASRYWPLQWLETGIFLTVAILMAWGCFWWVRRRLS